MTPGARLIFLYAIVSPHPHPTFKKKYFIHGSFMVGLTLGENCSIIELNAWLMLIVVVFENLFLLPYVRLVG